MLLPRLLTSFRNSSKHFSTLPTTSHLLSTSLNDLHLCEHLLDSPQISSHLSLLFSTPFNSCCLTSPQFHLPKFSQLGWSDRHKCKLLFQPSWIAFPVDRSVWLAQAALGLSQGNSTFGATIRLRLSCQSLRHNHCFNFRLSYHYRVMYVIRFYWAVTCGSNVQARLSRSIFPRARTTLTSHGVLAAQACQTP